jgi:hypothetical protein
MIAMKTQTTRFPAAIWRFLLAAVTIALAGCGHSQADTAASGGTPAAQQQAIQQNLAARETYAKSHATPGAQPN